MRFVEYNLEFHKIRGFGKHKLHQKITQKVMPDPNIERTRYDSEATYQLLVDAMYPLTK
jgi:hypothetical protein